MNTERKKIESKAVIVLDKIVKASELNVLAQNFEGDVIITKKIVIDENLDISCNLHLMGGIVRRSPISVFNINIDGDLYCYGEIHCNDINVIGCFYSEKLIYSKNIKVSGSLWCDAKIDAFGCNIVVAGNFECKGVVAEEIRVLGEASIEGSTAVTRFIKTGY